MPAASAKLVEIGSSFREEDDEFVDVDYRESVIVVDGTVEHSL